MAQAVDVPVDDGHQKQWTTQLSTAEVKRLFSLLLQYSAVSWPSLAHVVCSLSEFLQQLNTASDRSFPLADRALVEIPSQFES